jgi:glutamate-5-semialdehyde dehydrogenase
MSTGMREVALAARNASEVVAALPTVSKQELVLRMAAEIRDCAANILSANSLDIAAAQAQNQTPALLDRLRLDQTRIDAVIAALEAIAALPDPVGQVTRRETRPNGLSVERVRVPLGLIMMIYEARPSVTAEAAALCLMAGNAVILRGGSEARHSNLAISQALARSLDACGQPAAAATLITDARRECMIELLQLTDLVDLAIPRGGEGLIRFVAEHARVPVIKHYKGVCHLYVDALADMDLALRLLIDGKTTRPAVCNALETLLVHAGAAAQFLPLAAGALARCAVEMRGCERTRAVVAAALPATEEDYAAEFLELKIAIRVVDSLDDAIAHIRRFGSDHTEAIATRDAATANAFVHALRSAVVMVNASSRFSDGGELGLGAEIGISTTRLHAYGPMGLEALTVERFVVRGEGQVRHADQVDHVTRAG